MRLRWERVASPGRTLPGRLSLVRNVNRGVVTFAFVSFRLFTSLKHVPVQVSRVTAAVALRASVVRPLRVVLRLSNRSEFPLLQVSLARRTVSQVSGPCRPVNVADYWPTAASG